MLTKMMLVTASLVSLSAVSANAAVVFSDDFEGTALGALPLDSADVGEYVAADGSRPRGNVIATGTAGHPAAGPDGNPTQVHQTVGGASGVRSRAYGQLTTPAVTGDTIRFEWDSTLEAGAAFSFGLLGDAGSLGYGGLQSTAIIQFNLGATNIVQAYFGGAWNTLPGATHTAAVWERYAIEYTVGESSFTLQIGNNTPIVAPYATAAATSISRILILGGSTGVDGYTDNVVVTVVPEPASLALIGLGGLAMLARRREPNA